MTLKSTSPGPVPPPPAAKLPDSRSPGRRKRRDILHYRTRRRSDRATKSSSTSESSLSEFFKSASISKRSSKRKSKGEKSDKGKRVPKSEDPLTALTNHVRNQSNIPSLGRLPFEPVLRAGILILITSPTGETSLGLCDDDTSVTQETKKSRKSLWDFGL